ncbi:RYamide receptor-like [Mytilus edulis]|uniref:RYamide receptor-like n=1 Tax=Mytilus trossulus TaxID=6551 RepID=UPI0030059242
MNNSFTNETYISEQKISHFLQTIFIFLYSIIVVIAIGGNSIVCYLVYAYKRMRTIPNYFLVNLAISDIIMAIFCIPFTFVANLLLNYWPFGETMCPLVSYLQVVAVFLSAYTLVAMSFDRYIVIVHPFRPRITTRKTLCVIIIIWILSLSIPIPTLIKSKVQYYSNTSGQCLETWDNNHTLMYAYSTGIMVLHFFGPLVVLIFCYSRIGYNIWKKTLHGNDENKRRLQLASAKQKLIKMMATVVVFYALCWLPFHVITLVGDHDHTIYDQKFMPSVWVFSHWLAMSNSCYNPIIYIWLSPKFRAGLQLAVQKCTRRKSKNCDSNESLEKIGQNKNVILRIENRSSKVDFCYKKGQKPCANFEKLLAGDYNKIPGSIHSDT